MEAHAEHAHHHHHHHDDVEVNPAAWTDGKRYAWLLGIVVPLSPFFLADAFASLIDVFALDSQREAAASRDRAAVDQPEARVRVIYINAWRYDPEPVPAAQDGHKAMQLARHSASGWFGISTPREITARRTGKAGRCGG